jgi:acetyltransferase
MDDIRTTATAYRIRRIAPNDRHELARFYAAMSADSLAARFHGPTHGIGPSAAMAFCRPDHEHREGWLAVVLDHDGLERVIGHLCLEPDVPGAVEMAIAVADPWQRHGVGHDLLAAGVAWARTHEVAHLRASMRWGNDGILELVRSVGCPVALTSLDVGVLEAIIDTGVDVPRAA